MFLSSFYNFFFLCIFYFSFCFSLWTLQRMVDISFFLSLICYSLFFFSPISLFLSYLFHIVLQKCILQQRGQLFSTFSHLFLSLFTYLFPLSLSLSLSPFIIPYHNLYILSPSPFILFILSYFFFLSFSLFLYFS